MKLRKIRIKNYRCFKEQEVVFDDYNCFLGANGSGKSTVLMALNVFFRNTNAPSDVINLQEEDFHHRNTSENIEIRCTFDELDDDAKTDFQAYFRQDQLVISAIAKWNASNSRAEVKQFGSRMVMEEFVPYFDAIEQKAKSAELKEIYQSICTEYSELPKVSTMAEMKDALRKFEEANPNKCIEITAKNQFYGWSKGSNLLNKYIQWVYLPAVKDPSDEQDEQRNNALGTLLQRSIRSKVDFKESLEELRQKTNNEYRQLIESQDSVLKELGEKIEFQLKEWAHSGAKVELNWHFDDQKSVSVSDPFARARVGEGNFLGEIVRSGHGMQRSFLVSMLQVLSTIEDSDKSTLLLGFEEPELYQHPPQAKHLAALLEELSNKKTQIILTTHSPYFVSSKGYENIRRVSSYINGQSSTVKHLTYQDLSNNLADALGCEPQKPTELIASVEQIMQPSQTELFFCKIPVLVEGPEDIAFFSIYLKHMKAWNDFRRLGCHFVLCGGKTNMSRPLAIANGLDMNPFVIFDGDCDKSSNSENDQQRRDNGCILKLLGCHDEPIQEKNIFGSNFVMWKTRIMDEIRSEVGQEIWDTKRDEVRKKYSLSSSIKKKNPILVSHIVEALLESGYSISSLECAINCLLDFAKKYEG